MTKSPALFTARAIVDELVRGGVAVACVAPGSRSTALALAIAERPDLRAYVLTDERSMGFFAVGIARASRRPVALVTTSGTAAANLLPAAIEADLGGGALLVLTADRPPEDRDCASPQTVHQAGILGRHARWAVDVPLLDAGAASARVLRSIASRAVATAAKGRGGTVHLNVPLREPFVDDSFPSPATAGPAARGDGAPFTTVTAPQSLRSEDVAPVARTLSNARRGVIVCAGPAMEAGPVAALAGALGWPVLADPMSGLRFGDHDRSCVVDAVEPLLRDEALRTALAPDCVLRLGLTPAPRSVQRWLEGSWPAAHVVVDDSGGDAWPDPVHAASAIVRCDAASLCRALVPLVSHDPADRDWLRLWQGVSSASRRALDAGLDAEATLLDGAVVRAVVDALPDGATLFVGNSMPVRDADTFVASSPKRLTVMASRGASGIDGVLSAALGVACAAPGPVALVVGDLSFLHDAGALVFAARERIPLLVVVVNNDGGGIFTHLPLRASLGDGGLATFERFFGTPHGADLERVSAAGGGHFARVAERGLLAAAIREGLAACQHGPAVVEVRTDREAGRAAHVAIVTKAQAAAREVLAAAAAAPARRSA